MATPAALYFVIQTRPNGALPPDFAEGGALRARAEARDALGYMAQARASWVAFPEREGTPLLNYEMYTGDWDRPSRTWIGAEGESGTQYGLPAEVLVIPCAALDIDAEAQLLNVLPPPEGGFAILFPLKTAADALLAFGEDSPEMEAYRLRPQRPVEATLRNMLKPL